MPAHKFLVSWVAAVAMTAAGALPARAQGAYCGPADVAFVVDDTFSTAGVLSSLQSALPLILDRIAASTDPQTGVGPDYRLSLVTFKDDVTVRLAFSAGNRDAIVPLIAALQANAGGAGSGNASDEALNTVINALAAGTRPQNGDFAPPFRTDPAVRRIVILLTGHQPGGFDDDFRVEDIANAHQRALDARARTIKIFAIFTPIAEAQQGGAAVMLDYAASTGGVYVRTNDNPAVDPGLAVLNALSTCAPANKPPRALCGNAFEVAGPQCSAVHSTIDNGSYDPEDLPLASLIQTPPGPYPVGTTPVTLRVTDADGASASCQAVVTVDCLTPPPVVVVPPDTFAEATGPTGAIVSFTALATDYQGGPLTPSCTPASGSTFPLGTTEVTCSATDVNGTGTASFMVTVEDSTSPVLVLPSAITTSTPNPLGTIVTFSVTATDAVDPAPLVTCAPASGTTFAAGSTTIHCTARDATGNESAGSFTVTVNVADTTAPIVTLTVPAIVEALTASGAPVTFSASAVDDIDGTVPVTCDRTSGATFPLGPTTVTCTATDAAGNSGLSSATVTVVDTTPPALVLPAPITVSTHDAAGTIVSFAATATDLVDPSPLVTCSPVSGSSFPVGVAFVRCSASDARGNASAEGTFSITVRLSTVTSPSVSCSAGANPAGQGDKAGGGFFRVRGTSGVPGGPPPVLSLGSYVLTNGETIKLTVVPRQADVRLVNLMGGMRHFQVGPSAAIVTAVDSSGASATGACPIK